MAGTDGLRKLERRPSSGPGGATIAERRDLADAAFLHAAERRDLGRDDAFVNPDDAYYFPSLKAGNARMRTARPIAKFASRRKCSPAGCMVDSTRPERLAGSFKSRKWESGFLGSIRRRRSVASRSEITLRSWQRRRISAKETRLGKSSVSRAAWRNDPNRCSANPWQIRTVATKFPWMKLQRASRHAASVISPPKSIVPDDPSESERSTSWRRRAIFPDRSSCKSANRWRNQVEVADFGQEVQFVTCGRHPLPLATGRCRPCRGI